MIVSGPISRRSRGRIDEDVLVDARPPGRDRIGAAPRPLPRHARRHRCGWAEGQRARRRPPRTPRALRDRHAEGANARRRPLGGSGAHRARPDRRPRRHRNRLTLYLSEDEVQELLAPADALEAVEASFVRMAADAVELTPRRRLGLQEGRLADMAASDLELGYAGVKSYAGFAEGAAFVFV